MSKNIYAYTGTDYKTYPDYISYNKTDRGMMLTVRSKESDSCQEVEFPLFRFWQFVDAVTNFNLPADVTDIEFLPKEFFTKLAGQYTAIEQELALTKQKLETLGDTHSELQASLVDVFGVTVQERLEAAEALSAPILKDLLVEANRKSEAQYIEYQAMRQRAEAAEQAIEKLRREVAMLNRCLELFPQHFHDVFDLESECEICTARNNTQATAEAYEREIQAATLDKYSNLVDDMWVRGELQSKGVGNALRQMALELRAANKGKE